MQSVEKHRIERVRHETRRRMLTVAAVRRLSPSMMRVEFVSPELSDFRSASPDDHVKLFFRDAEAPETNVSRDYTPRAFDVAAGRLTIDFALHEEAGPATAWAMRAAPGDTLEIGGPRGSAVAPDDFDFYLLIGDETALPSIGRRVGELRAGVPVFTFVVVGHPADAQVWETAANWRPVWIPREGREEADDELLRAALETWRAPAGEGFVWIAAEARVARALRDDMLGRGHPKAWLKAAGYWVRGAPGAEDKNLDG